MGKVEKIKEVVKTLLVPDNHNREEQSQQDSSEQEKSIFQQQLDEEIARLKEEDRKRKAMQEDDKGLTFTDYVYRKVPQMNEEEIEELRNQNGVKVTAEKKRALEAYNPGIGRRR